MHFFWQYLVTETLQVKEWMQVLLIECYIEESENNYRAPANCLSQKAKISKERRGNLMGKQAKQPETYNKGAKDLPVMEEGEVVRMKPHVLGNKMWKIRLDEHSYEIAAEDGNINR